MNYSISSDRLKNPLLKGLLKVLSVFFKGIGEDFYIIGATARDIVLSGIHHQEPGRETNDLDIAIAIPDWSRYQEISDLLCKLEGFRKSKSQQQRFWYKDVYMVDIVPFGNIAKADHHIYWPPEEIHAMSVAGFPEVVKRSIMVMIDDDLEIYVATLPGIFILKLNAWHDRYLQTNRDAEDLAFILANYLEINEERAARDHYDLYEAVDFSTLVAGASLMGRDIKDILRVNPAILQEIRAMLTQEIEKQDESMLINQILETHGALKYEDIYNSFLSIANELSK